MRFHPTRNRIPFLYFIIASLLLLISCSKDSDLLRDTILSDSTEAVEVTEQDAEAPVDVVSEPEVIEEPEDSFESRTTSFPASNDAHVSQGTNKGYNQKIIRLEEGNRTSYLMFDLSPIEAIKGQITTTSLQFTVDSDNGDGNLTVYKGASNDWTEENIEESNTPEIAEELGSLTKEYTIGATETIALNSTDLSPEVTSLIIDHKDGNDLAFASKEHPSKTGPKLVVTYTAPINADEIVPVEEVEQVVEEETPTEETPTEETPTEETPAEEATNEEPIAIADGSPSSGQVPLEVTFSGSNSSDDGEIVSYKWDFKDGSTATNANPKHTFAEIGTYQVILTVTDDQGIKTEDKVTINVNAEENEGPVAVAGATPISGEAPLEVTFKGNNSTDDTRVTSYKWDFKDGSTATNANPKHTFDTPGTYKVDLTVKDEQGLSNKKTITITVAEPKNIAPKAIVSANVTSGVIPLTVNFTGNKSTDDKKVTNYSWNFKDGSSATTANPQHVFKSAGTYLVELTVKDAEGLTNKKTISIKANAPSNEGPRANGSANTYKGEAPLTVKFTGDKSTDDDGVTAYSWNFKDGSTSTATNPTHTFENAGTYKVELTVTDANGATDTDIDTITVTAPNSGNTGGNTGGSNGNHPSHAVFASSFGFKAGDATDAFVDAIKSNNSYIVIDKQSSDWVIKPTRLFNVDNKTIVFEDGVVLRAKSGAYNSKTAVLFNLYESVNVTVKGYGATLKMNKNEYGSSEFRHAILLDGCKNITIEGLSIIDSGGDGIMINTSQSKSFSENITVENVSCVNSSRNGLTVISAKDVWIRNSTFSQSKGQAPEAGIGLEPDSSGERLQNINISNCNLNNNYGPGFYLGTLNLRASSTPINIEVNNTVLSSNARNTNYPKPLTELRLMDSHTGSNNVNGTIRFNKLNFNGSKSRIIWSQKADDSYDVIFRDCRAKNVSTSQANPIHLEGNINLNSLGGFDFGNFYLEYSSNKSFMKLNVPAGVTLKNIKGNFTVKEPGNNPIDYNTRANPANGINVDINYTHIN